MVGWQTSSCQAFWSVYFPANRNLLQPSSLLTLGFWLHALFLIFRKIRFYHFGPTPVIRIPSRCSKPKKKSYEFTPTPSTASLSIREEFWLLWPWPESEFAIPGAQAVESSNPPLYHPPGSARCTALHCICPSLFVPSPAST